MKKNKFINPKIFAVVFIIFLLFFISELLYALHDKWILFSYILKTSKVLNNIGFTKPAFYISTEFKYKMPENDQFTQEVGDYYRSLPKYFNLPSYLYLFGVSAYKNGFTDLTPKLFDLAIKMDPDFSYWYVELANYYFLRGETNLGEKTIADCIKLQYPKNHCEDFMNTYIKTKQTYDVGFLSADVNKTLIIITSFSTLNSL